jgi:hypothetical protein
MVAMLGYRWRVDWRSPAGFPEMRIVPRYGHRTSGNAAAERLHHRVRSHTRDIATDREMPGLAIRSIRGTPITAHLIQIVPLKWTLLSPF